MEQAIELIKLSLDRINELGQKAFTAHENCMRYSPDNDENKIKHTEDSVCCKRSLEKQHGWVCAIKEVFDI